MTTRQIRDDRVALPEVDLRPQSVLLTFFGDYVIGDSDVVAASSVIALLEAAHVGAYATRATLNRMVKRGLLCRATSGRNAYFGLTEYGRRAVLDGKARVHRDDVINRSWDGTWTLVSFSMPEDAQRARHELRARLSWAGFGMVQAGLWAAPRDVDIAALLSDLDTRHFVKAFRGAPIEPTDAAAIVTEAFDLASQAARYGSFAERWTAMAQRVGTIADPLTARVVLTTDWLQVIRDDPRLPVSFLPPEWPAARAHELFVRLDAALRRPAMRAARQRLDVRSMTGGQVT